MTKSKDTRTGAPVVTQVPWGAPQTPPTPNEQANENAEQRIAELDAAAAEFEALGDTFDPTTDLGPKEDSEQTPSEFAEKIRAAFTGQPIEQPSPFAPKPKAAPAPEPEVFPMGDAPSWGELVGFVQKHGDVIIQVRYPQPRGVAIDTIYRGVTVITHEKCQLRHVNIGWIDWADAQYK